MAVKSDNKPGNKPDNKSGNGIKSVGAEAARYDAQEKRAGILVRSHINKWDSAKLSPETQCKRINFILARKDKHKRILTSHVVEQLETVLEDSEKNRYSKRGQKWFNLSSASAVLAGLVSWTPLNLNTFVPIGLFTLALGGGLMAAYNQYKTSNSIGFTAMSAFFNISAGYTGMYAGWLLGELSLTNSLSINPTGLVLLGSMFVVSLAFGNLTYLWCRDKKEQNKTEQK